MSDGGGGTNNPSAMEEGGLPSNAIAAGGSSSGTERRRRRRRRLGDARTARSALSFLLTCPWRQVAVLLIYVLAMSCLFSVVASGAFELALFGWGIIVAVVIFGSVWLARVVHNYAWRSSEAGRRRHRIPRGALEARLQLRHPGIELGRLRLLLVDRDFTGEDYQALLDLDDANEVPSTVGASEGEIRRNPSFLVKEPEPGSTTKSRNCTICLYPFKPRERVRIIPCLHQFHTQCIDPWLRQNAICPVCKFPAVG